MPTLGEALWCLGIIVVCTPFVLLLMRLGKDRRER